MSIACTFFTCGVVRVRRFELIPWSEVEERFSKRRDQTRGDTQTYRQDRSRRRNKAGYTGEGFTYGGRGGGAK